MKYANGDFYDGESFGNKRNGNGTFKLACGAIYQGKWSNDAF